MRGRREEVNNEETSGGVNEVPLKRDFSEFSSLFFFVESGQMRLLPIRTSIYRMQNC